jgi:hypothetical protein
LSIAQLNASSFLLVAAELGSDFIGFCAFLRALPELIRVVSAEAVNGELPTPLSVRQALDKETPGQQTTATITHTESITERSITQQGKYVVAVSGKPRISRRRE